MKCYLFLLVILLQYAKEATCQNKKRQTTGDIQTDRKFINVQIIKYSPKLDKIINEGEKAEVIAEGLSWCEGPLWVEKEEMLLFSDIPNNTVFKWTSKRGKEIYLKPSGYTGNISRGGEIGSNGLMLNAKGQLVLCQHGDRRLALMDAPIDQPAPNFITIAGEYNGKKFDSPNDVAMRSNGDSFFTDPPYGLEKNVNDPGKEASYQGVYRVTPDGVITMLNDTISRPNGIAFFPKENQLLIANSDYKKPYWYLYDISEQDELINGRIFYDATDEVKTEPGLPDGLKIDNNGTVFASGPGGIWIFDKDSNLLGKIKVNDLVSNCAISNDRRLFITANKRVLVIKLK